jgi:EpsI family protein
MTQSRYFIPGLIMLLAACAAALLTPTQKMADVESRIELERLIPLGFGDWKIDTSLVPVKVDPALQASLNKIYNQTLSRTYINSQGQRIMLSIAYGGDQRSDMQVHRPEVCYPAQGFQVLSNEPGVLNTRYGAVPVRRLETRAVQRWEPVTYWMTIGDKAVVGLVQRKLAALAYGLNGTIPDGLLFRISSIDRDSSKAFAAQSAFVSQLLESLDELSRRRLAGLGHISS